MYKILWLLVALAMSPLVRAEVNLEIHHAYARATPPNAVTSAIFAQIDNHDNEDRYIVAAVTPAAGKTELHDVVHEGEVMKMRQVKSLKIPANGTLQLQPGSFHIMLFDMPEPLLEGNNIEVQIKLKNGEQYRFSVPVKNVMAGMKQH